MICPSCFGAGKITCFSCNGKGQGRPTPNRSGGLDFPICGPCGGRGKLNCNTCRGTGVVPDPVPPPLPPKPPPIPKDPFVGAWVNQSGAVMTVVKTPDGYGISEDGQIAPADFSISGNKVVMKTHYNGVQIQFSGVINGDEMSGQMFSAQAMSYRRQA